MIKFMYQDKTLGSTNNIVLFIIPNILTEKKNKSQNPIRMFKLQYKMKTDRKCCHPRT